MHNYTAMFTKKDMIIIIGAGLFQVKAIQEAKALGLTVLAVDRDAHAPGRQYCDLFEQISTKDIDAVTACAEAYANEYTVRGVFTAGTDVAFTVACVAEQLGLPGARSRDVLAATNKYLMRLRLREHGVRVPHFAQAKSREEALCVAEDIGFPLVIKPVDNMGARGVRRIDSLDDLNAHFDIALHFSGNYADQAVILEEFMDGPEISMDTLVINGVMHVITIADRHIGYPPYFVEFGHSIPSQLPDVMLRDAREVMAAAIKAIGIENGAAKADIKITSEGAKIGEITARLSGGFHSQYTEYLATGMNSTRAAVMLAVGVPVDMRDITSQWDRVAIERAVIMDPGQIESIDGIEDACALDGVEHIFLNMRVGDTVEPITSNLGKVANIIATGRTREEAEEVVLKAEACLAVTISPVHCTVR